MEKINVGGQLVHANVMKNRELYAELPLFSDKGHCGCDDCTYFEKAIIHASSEVLQFFQQFGVDPRKEAEVWRAGENDDGTYYYVCDYHFIGEIADADELDWIDVGEATFGLTNYNGDLPSNMIPESFHGPIVEMLVKINVPGDIK